MKKATGFTLIEALAAMAILVIAVLVIIQLFPAGLNVSRSSKNEIKAIDLAQGEIESIRDLAYADITNVARTRISSDQTSPYFIFEKEVIVSYVNGSLTTSEADLGLKKVTVNIYWPEGDQTKSISSDFIKHK